MWLATQTILKTETFKIGFQISYFDNLTCHWHRKLQRINLNRMNVRFCLPKNSRQPNRQFYIL